MYSKLYWNTVTPLLQSALNQLMASKVFQNFRLVGGTALSLQLGHRISVDIDLFSDAAYETIDFKEIDIYLRRTFSYATNPDSEIIGMGRSYFIGEKEREAVKLDLYYTDTFIQPPIIIENIRMATIEEIIAMKIDVVQRGGRKKDFWDLHEIMEKYSIEQMLTLHKKRYPYNHDAILIKKNLIDFSEADQEFEPDCLRGKHWELIKLEIIESLD